MKNIITCSNCGAENPFYNFTCIKCKTYLRDRIYNIDLWKVISLLIESPLEAYTIIIRSEHKNFVNFIIILASAKFFLDSAFFSLLEYKEAVTFDNPLISFSAVLIFIFFLLIIFSYLLKKINKIFELDTRVKDNFSILTYSLIPHVFALFLLFTVELVVFGGTLFSANPSPFVVKKSMAYALLSFEILVVLWSLFLSIMAMFTQSKNWKYSIITGITFQALLFCFLFFLPGILKAI